MFHNYGVAQGYLQQGRLEEATDLFKQTLKQALDKGYNTLALDLYAALAETAQLSGRLPEAIVYLRRSHLLESFLTSENDKAIISELDYQYRNSENSRLLAITENETLEQARLLGQRQWIIGFLILSLGMLFLLINDLRRKKRLVELTAKQQLLQREQSIAKLEKERDLNAMQALFSGQEQERRRIARDLHDGLGGMLYALQLQLSIDQQPPELIDIVRQALAENRRISENLLPPTLDRLGLIPALEEWVQFFNTTWPVYLQLEVESQIPELNPDMRISLFRIAQELTNNVARHARASSATLQLATDDDFLILSVSDDGCGFDQQAAPDSLLKTVRSRTQLLKGALQVSTKPGQGTTVTIRIPAPGEPVNQPTVMAGME